MFPQNSSKRAEWIENLIDDFVTNSDENTLKNQIKDKAFENPLVGFSNGGESLYESFKEYVGPFHWTPVEIFNMTFPHGNVEPEELTIISWILPHIEATKADNRKESIYPADRWARGRIYGEEVNARLLCLSSKCIDSRAL